MCGEFELQIPLKASQNRVLLFVSDLAITIPRSVRQIEESCFASCARLDDFAFEKESKLQ
jgi:hypothetical protein